MEGEEVIYALYIYVFVYIHVYTSHTPRLLYFPRAMSHPEFVSRALPRPDPDGSFFCVQAALRMARLCHGERTAREMGPGKEILNNPFSHMWRPHASHMSTNNAFFALFFSGATSVGRRSAGSSSRLGLLRSRPSAR